ncbi:MAG: thioredoxin domain-containing protein [Acidimicrobiia bacterium]
MFRLLTMVGGAMPNRLSAATSPYLLQHAENPVDWYQWGEEALRRAKEDDKPILLSVGYASCHWCHVMAHESFEDPETARLMNRLFVNIKVDREERPDVDAIYMDAVQALTGHGGWPMTVFLTPDAHPFYAGTYFPKEGRHGLPSFRQVLEGVAEAWAGRRNQVVDQAERLTEAISRQVAPAGDLPERDVLEAAYQGLQAQFDSAHGGFGGAPKFPQAPVLEFLLRIAGEPWAPEALPMAYRTLEAMARGGIYDHLGGGFARYSVDSTWLVPHFEKMLYDNAQLARLYLRAWQETGEERLRQVAVETLEYLLRDLSHPEGGFFSGEDADSEGVEGRFYVFGHDEFRAAVGAEDAHLAADYFGVTPRGNFEGQTILHEAAPLRDVAQRHGLDPGAVRDALARAKERLRVAREQRVRPGLDDKVVVAWNGLALRGLAEAGAVLGEDRYLEAARRNARFVLDKLQREGRLLRSWRDGRAAPVAGFCEDYAAYAVGLFALYQATGELEWYREARRLATEMVQLFADPVNGGFYSTGHDAEQLLTRPKDLMDNPLPSGNSLAAEALLTLSLYTGDVEVRRLADGAFRQAGRLLDEYPSAAGHLLAVLHTALSGPKEVAIVGPPGHPDTRALAGVVWERFRPDCVLATDPGDGSSATEIPLLEGRHSENGPPLAYVCRNFTCRAPVGEPDDLRAQL